MLPRRVGSLAAAGAIAGEQPRFLTQAGFEIFSNRFKFTRDRIWTVPYVALITFLVAGYTYIFFLLKLENLRLMFVIPAGAIFYMFTSEFVRGRTFRMTQPQGRLVTAFVVIVIFTGAFAINRGASFNEFQNFIKMVFLYILATNAITHPRQLHITLVLIALSSTVPAIGAIFNYLTGGPLREGFRAAWIGNFWDSNRFAGVLAMGLPAHVYAMRESRFPGSRLLFIGTLGLSLAAIVLSGSRGGMLALAAVCGAGLLVANRRGLILLAVVAAAGAMFVAAPERILSRWTSESLTTGTGRTLIWGNGLRILLQRPVTGVGIGNFYWATGETYTESARETTRYRGAHNTWLQVGAETGLLGLACFAGLFFTSLLDMRRLWREGRGGASPAEADAEGGATSAEGTRWVGAVAATIFASLLGMGIGALTVDYGYEWYVYVFIALAVVLKQLHRDALAQQAAGAAAGDAPAAAEATGSAGAATLTPPPDEWAGAPLAAHPRSAPAGGERAPTRRQRQLEIQARRLAARVMAQQDAEMGRGPRGIGAERAGRRFTGTRLRG